MTAERAVRFTEEFFSHLDDLLPDGRSVEGEPSATDFLLFDLPPIRDKLARNFEGESLATQDPEIRVYIGNGVLFRSVAVFARLAIDGAVEAVWLHLDSG